MSKPSQLHSPHRRRPLLSLAWATALVLSLGACGDHTPDAMPVAAAASAAPQAVAMARGVVEVQGGLLDLAFEQDGLVASVSAKEGQSVRRGHPLAVLSDTTAAAELTVAQSELRLSQARIEAQAQKLPTLRLTASRLGSAAQAGAAEPQRAEEAQQAVRDLESEILVARAEADVVRSRIAALRAQRARLSLPAPEDGVVLRVAVKPGQRFQAAATAVTLLPNRPLQVRAEVSESYIDKLHVGQHALVATDGDAAAQALPAARLVRISPVLAAGHLQDDNHRGPSRSVECILEFDKVPAARVGQNVKVSFYD